jgi:hypothetical protein
MASLMQKKHEALGHLNVKEIFWGNTWKNEMEVNSNSSKFGQIRWKVE